MIVTTHIDISPAVYRFFLHQAENDENTTPEEMISRFLEAYVKKQTQFDS